MLWLQLASDQARSVAELPNDRLFTYLVTNGRIRSTNGGLHLTDVHFLKCLASAYSPRRILVTARVKVVVA